MTADQPADLHNDDATPAAEPKKARAPRKKKPELDAPLDDQVAFRFNEARRLGYTKAAERAGLPLQTWMRRVLDRAAGLANPKRI